MSTLTLRKIDTATAQFTRRLGGGASLGFNAQGKTGLLQIGPLIDSNANRPPMSVFNSAIGTFGLSDAEAILSVLGELPVTLGGDFQPWYWQVLNQRFSPVIAELLSPLEPHSDITVLSSTAITCRIQLQWADQTLHSLICADADVLLRLLEGAGWEAQRRDLDEQWPINPPLVLGQLSLSLAQLASLQPGDVLLPSLCDFDSEGQGRLKLGGRQWAVQTDSHERQLYVRLSHEENLEHGQRSAL